jgi:hypothetical protein
MQDKTISGFNKKTTRVQYLDFNLIRSGFIKRSEHAILSYISSFSNRCCSKLDDIAIGTGYSRRTVQYAINKLVQKGLLKKSYTTFKRCVLQIVDLSVQKTLNSGSQILKSVFRFAKRIKKSSTKSSDVQNTTCPDVQTHTQPTRLETLRNKTENKEKNFSWNTFNTFKIHLSAQEINERKNKQLEAYKNYIQIKEASKI